MCSSPAVTASRPTVSRPGGVTWPRSSGGPLRTPTVMSPAVGQPLGVEPVHGRLREHRSAVRRWSHPLAVPRPVGHQQQGRVQLVQPAVGGGEAEVE
ncbi:hypothetical protein QLR68_01110, partial [Micromonospora sp. DH15]|nr:hypothetical protein [Micromonospora sp. DH15]